VSERVRERDRERERERERRERVCWKNVLHLWLCGICTDFLLLTFTTNFTTTNDICTDFFLLTSPLFMYNYQTTRDGKYFLGESTVKLDSKALENKIR